jgi:hypothetical protein
MRPRKPRSRNIGSGGTIKQVLTPETLRELYVVRQHSMSDIAKHYGCSKQYVSQLCHRYQIARTPLQKRPSNPNTAIGIEGRSDG